MAAWGRANRCWCCSSDACPFLPSPSQALPIVITGAQHLSLWATSVKSKLSHKQEGCAVFRVNWLPEGKMKGQCLEGGSLPPLSSTKLSYQCRSEACPGSSRDPAFNSATSVHNLKLSTLNMLHCTKSYQSLKVPVSWMLKVKIQGEGGLYLQGRWTGSIVSWSPSLQVHPSFEPMYHWVDFLLVWVLLTLLSSVVSAGFGLLFIWRHWGLCCALCRQHFQWTKQSALCLQRPVLEDPVSPFLLCCHVLPRTARRRIVHAEHCAPTPRT